MERKIQENIDNEIIECPYDSNHKVRRIRMLWHLAGHC